MSQPTQLNVDDMSPGSPRWYLSRLTQRLLARQSRYDRLERYATGDHPLPNGDRRYVMALRELQRLARTNYCLLIYRAVTQRMKVVGFQFGPDQQVDEDAKAIWNYNDMDYQSQLIIKNAAIFGDTYVLVSPPIEDDGEPIITAEDPRQCIVEVDPRRPTVSLAGLKMWQDDIRSTTRAVLYMPDAIYEYEGPSVTDIVGVDRNSLTTLMAGRTSSAGQFRLVSVQENPAGIVTLIRGNWQPAFGQQGRGEFEDVLDIQDRINRTILDRLVISKSQAYNQRWVTGATKGDNFKPGSDMVWATLDSNAKFGQFEAADITQILEAIRDDVGDMAAVSETPATYLMNRMVNVSGDTLTQDQSALVTKVGLRQEAMGWMYAKVMRSAFAFKNQQDKAKETEVVTLWKNAQIHTLAELSDSFAKFTAGGVPLDIAMQITGLFTNDQIESAKQQFEEMMQQQQDMALEQQQVDGQNQMAVTKQQGANQVAAAKAKPRPSP